MKLILVSIWAAFENYQTLGEYIAIVIIVWLIVSFFWQILNGGN